MWKRAHWFTSDRYADAYGVRNAPDGSPKAALPGQPQSHNLKPSALYPFAGYSADAGLWGHTGNALA